MKLLPPKKRTLSHQESPDSSQNPSHSVLPQKKTRDLPNLTECHACGFKVDVCTTGKNKLRPLYSEWRVVLLCNKCFSCVESSKICSYCFSQASPESFRCIQCRHSVHKSCFLKYKDSAPWSYSCLGSEFSVCVDCWIPKPLEISRIRRRKMKNGMIQKKGRITIEGGGNLVRSMEDLIKDANLAVEMKVEVAARARDEAMKKAVVARKAIELANSALSLVANREESSCLNLPPKMAHVRVIDDLDLTFDLHPHFHRLPRISKSCCSLKTSYFNVPKRWAFSFDSSCRTLYSRNARGCGKHEVSNGHKQDKDSCKSSCELSVSIGLLDTDLSTDQNCHCMGRNGMKTSAKDGECTAEFDAQEIGEELLKEGEGSCSDRPINISGEDSGMELDRKQADSVLQGEELCIRQPDRYFLKYSRRKFKTKSS